MLFEWKPRSLIPVALASVAATVARSYLPGLGPDALFATPLHAPVWTLGPLLACVLVGILAGILAVLLTLAVYVSEDMFHKLPIHWTWWPIIGGVVIGIGGLIYPPALGVGYDLIHQLVLGNFTLQMIFGLLIVKAIMWAVSLSSGTSGGVLAPLLLIGGALGALESLFLPAVFPGFWPLISMAAVLGATIGCPLTIVVFAIELTHNVTTFLPLLLASIVAYGLVVLVMRRSILTEKISRRGYHLSREYATDPLEILFVREAMRTNVIALTSTMNRGDLLKLLSSTKSSQEEISMPQHQHQRLYPVLDADKRLLGVVTRKDLEKLFSEHAERNGAGSHDEQVYELASVIHSQPVVAYTDEPLRATVYRMAEFGLTRFPVVERERPEHLLGMISLQDSLKARVRNLDEERHRERVLKLRLLFASRPSERVVELEPDPDPGSEMC
jgi:CBS domain-containing protein